MHTLKLIGWGYLYLSLGIALIVFACLAVEDIGMVLQPYRRSMSKFGYNLIPNLDYRYAGWGNVFGVGWWIVIGCLPGINLVLLVLWFGLPLLGRLRKRA